VAYKRHLSDITFDKNLTRHFRKFHSATARQRCKALILAFGL
jgi:hypothetical protein